MQKKIKILCTVGPSSINEKVLKRFEAEGVDLVRINLSHTKIEDLRSIIEFIKRHTDVPICIDTEGAQIRNGFVNNNRLALKENQIIDIVNHPVVGNEKQINFNPPHIISKLEVGDLVYIDFNTVLLQVIEKHGDHLSARVISGGIIGNNKGVDIDRDIDLPALSAKDIEATAIMKEYQIRHIALSFVNKKEDVICLKNHLAKEALIISKVECKNALDNLDEIIDVSDAILIDRGDLSRKISIEKIPLIQKIIIKRANSAQKPVYVATNLLESMIENRMPTRAEVNDILTCLIDGAQGLVLAAETAIGAHPVEAVMVVKNMIQQYGIAQNQFDIPTVLKSPRFFLPEPHGGKLVNRFIANSETKKWTGLKQLKVSETVILDAEQIALGAFSPLEGFMNREELHSVLDDYRLPTGITWTLPVLLQVTEEEKHRLAIGETIVLVNANNDKPHSLLHIDGIFEIDHDEVALKWFGTTDLNHPGVFRLKNGGNHCIGGKIDLLEWQGFKNRPYELSPMKTREVFEFRRWKDIVGFHTRNVRHKAHEYIQKKALEKVKADGLFIHPVVGLKKKGDFESDVIINSYQIAMENYHKNDMLIAAFRTYSRYSGPREAVFTALCRKNFGCSYFIVGRDHTGVGNYYTPDASQKLFHKLGDLGIAPIFFNQVSYCTQCADYVEKCQHNMTDTLSISGVEARKMLSNKVIPPEWYMDKKISNFIVSSLKEGKKVFVE